MRRLPLTAEKVYLRAGVYTHTFPLAGQFRPSPPYAGLSQFGLFAFWPKGLNWLRLSGHADGGAGGPSIPLQGAPADLDAVCAAHAARRDQVAPPKLLEAHCFLTCSLPQNNRVFLTVEIDTDDEGFRRAVRERRNSEKAELVQAVQLMYFDSKQFGNLVYQPGVIEFVLKPCAPLPKYNGVLAIDLGNTSTTATAMSEADPVYRSSSVRLVPLDADADLGGDPGPLPSVVRLDQIVSTVDVPEGMRRFPGLPGDDRPTAVAFVVGGLAAVGSAGDLPSGVVFGAKQLLHAKPAPAGPDATEREAAMSMAVAHARPGGAPQVEAVEVLSRLPGELLFTHAVRRFRRAAGSWPADLALTYPTTYGPRELFQLTRAAVRGWLRALGQPQDLGGAHEPNEDAQLEELGALAREWLRDPSGACRLVGLALDEATAAAFFHIYRRVFESPGGLVRFRYLHPDGLRLLLIDCGGGTTDVALVHAFSRPATPALVEIDVLARTGLRGFGGDHITRAVCRLLKAKMLCALARARGLPGGPPPLPASAPAKGAAELVTGFLDRARQLDQADEMLPTTFDLRLADAGTLRRKTCFQALWQLAEAVKVELGRGKPVKLRDVPPPLLGRGTSPLVAAAVQPLPAAAQGPFLAQLADLTVAAWEVDALVRGPVEAVMKRCNRLIRKHLTDDPAGDKEVDWVVVSGNGARYPLVARLAKEMLAVADVADRIHLDQANSKNAVAKGAALARMVERVPRTLGIKFNRHLSELLPFDVGYHNMITNETQLLFREYTPYKDLATAAPRVRLVPPSGATEGLGNTFVLERRFPGDDAFEPFASYRFPGGISGEVVVRYDPASGEFRVSDAGSGLDGEPQDLLDQEHAPVAMRGDI